LESNGTRNTETLSIQNGFTSDNKPPQSVWCRFERCPKIWFTTSSRHTYIQRFHPPTHTHTHTHVDAQMLLVHKN
jgi:hypothetical protein